MTQRSNYLLLDEMSSKDAALYEASSISMDKCPVLELLANLSGPEVCLIKIDVAHIVNNRREVHDSIVWKETIQVTNNGHK